MPVALAITSTKADRVHASAFMACPCPVCPRHTRPWPSELLWLSLRMAGTRRSGPVALLPVEEVTDACGFHLGVEPFRRANKSDARPSLLALARDAHQHPERPVIEGLDLRTIQGDGPGANPSSLVDRPDRRRDERAPGCDIKTVNHDKAIGYQERVEPFLANEGIGRHRRYRPWTVASAAVAGALRLRSRSSPAVPRAVR